MNYIVQSSISLVVFYAIYFFFLKNNKFFNWQRIYLLVALASSLLIPLVEVNFQVEEKYIGVEQFASSVTQFNELHYIAATGKSTEIFNLWNLLIVVYSLMVLFLSIRLLGSFLGLIKLISNGRTIIKDGFKVILTQEEIPISSFGRYIIINEKNEINNAEFDCILRHEKKHITDKHSVDIVLIEILKVIFWFHPAVYLYDKSIKKIHEFICDHEVLRHNSLDHYELILIRSFFKRIDMPFLSQFNEVSIKNRIKMMNKKESVGFNANLKKVSFLAALPMMITLVLLFNIKGYASSQLLADNISEEISFYLTPIKGMDLTEIPGKKIVKTEKPIKEILNPEIERATSVELSPKTLGHNESLLEGIELKSVKIEKEEKDRHITGTISIKGEGTVDGAMVIVVGANIGAITDANGNYALDVPKKYKKLEFSYLKVKKVTVEIKNRKTIDVVLKR